MLCLFNKKSVGIDIADHRILVTRLKKSGGSFVIDYFSNIPLVSGVVENGRIKNKIALTEAIKVAMKNVKAETACEKRIVFGIPKNQAYVHIFSDNSNENNKDEIEQIIKKDVEGSIPLEAEDIYYSYKLLHKENNVRTFLVVAVSKEVIFEWQDFFTSVGVDVQVYDLSSLATYRNLYKNAPKKPICMLDIGGDSTSISIFDNRGLRYSHAVRFAGIEFSEQIAETLNISFEEAEKLKIKFGMPKTGKLFPIMKKNLEPIIKTTQEIFDYVKKTGDIVEKIILVGASSSMKGLPEYLQTVFGIPVELGQPIIAGKKSDYGYLNSIGLALRGFEKRSNQKDPGLLPLKREKKIKIPTVKSRVYFQADEKLIQAPDLDEIAEHKKIKNQKIILAVIVFLGLVLFGLAFWYRNYQTQMRLASNSEKVVPYSVEEKITLQIPVATEKDEYAIDRVKGRIVETLDVELSSGENIWTEPVLQDPNRWLAYSETDAKSLFLAKIKSDVTNDFSLGETKYLEIIKTENSRVYLLKAELTIYTPNPL